MCVFIGIMAKRVAVILSGCGVYDGTEVHEASAILVHLSRAGAKVRARKGLLHIHLSESCHTWKYLNSYNISQSCRG